MRKRAGVVTLRGTLGASAVIGMLAVTLGLAFGATRAWRGEPPPRDRRTPYTDGNHLVAYVILSSTCGFCTDRLTKKAITALRPSLRRHQDSGFARVTVVGITIDSDLEVGVKYLASQSGDEPAFDEISVGSGWENYFVSHLMWREGYADAKTPTVIVVSRAVDASRFPGGIIVTPDSLLVHIPGRDSLIAWVNSGTPLPRPVTVSAKSHGSTIPARRP